jgi:hypothetical protein
VVDRPGGTDDSTEDRDEPAMLGAAEPLTVGRGTRPPRDSWRPKNPHFIRWAVLIVVGLVVLALVPAFIGGLKKTPRNRYGISYGGGPIEGVHFQRTIAPGSGLFFNGFYDPLFLYPSDQVNYIISKQVGVGASKKPDSITAPTKDRVQVTYEVAVYFKLNTDLLRQFHEQLGVQYKAYTTAGWNALIRDTFRQQIENALQEETRRVNVPDLFGSAEQLVKVQNEVQRKLTQRLRDATGHEFFCAPTFKPGGECGNPTFVIKKVSIPASVAKAFQDNKTSEIQIVTKQNEIAQRAAEAQAIRELGLTGQQYATLKAIESGKINFWVLPEDSGLNLTAPSAGSLTTPSTTTTTTTKPRKNNG